MDELIGRMSFLAAGGKELLPTPTPVPVDTGDWTYFSPDCPSAYPNCAVGPSENVFISLEAFDHFSDVDGDSPYLLVGCNSKGRVEVLFGSGGLTYGKADEVLAGAWIGDGEIEDLMTPAFIGDAYVGLGYNYSLGISRLIYEAEETNQYFGMGTLYAEKAVNGTFDPTGFTVTIGACLAPSSTMRRGISFPRRTSLPISR